MRQVALSSPAVHERPRIERMLETLAAAARDQR
jgi:hypothetical protein